MNLNISQHLTKLKSFFIECQRVLSLTKKPSKEEFKTIVKASALGMAIIGALGFVIHMTFLILRQ